jgi:putative ABC transport system ATP-binding protein
VLITHDASIATEAERIIRLADGKVIFDGSSKAFSGDYTKLHREENE